MAWHRWMAVSVAASAVVCLLTNVSPAQPQERPYVLDLRLDCPRQNILVGDEIPIVFTITNRDTASFSYSYYFDDPDRSVWEYRLTARRRDSTTVPYPGEDELPIVGGPNEETRRIGTNQSFQKTIPLNRWARIIEPGRYMVIGTYSYYIRANKGKSFEENGPAKEIRVRSKPIEIDVKARSDREMGEYIQELISRLQSLKGKEDNKARRERERLAARLAFTCDKRIVPTMLDLLYERAPGNEHIEALIAFCCYLPPDADVQSAVLSAIKTRGLIYTMGIVMRRLGVSEPDAAEVIRTSLSSRDRETVAAALAVMQDYPADEHVPRLVAIALGPDSVLPHGSMWALAMHRTDEGIATLQRLLSDSDPNIRKRTSDCIRAGYYAHPCYPEQIDEAYTRTLASVAGDPNHQHRYNIIREIIRTRTREGVDHVRMLLADPNADVPLADTDLGIRAIRNLLRDADPNVREIAKEHVKWACHESPGRGLRPDDFPPEFREDLERRKQRILEGWLKAE